MLTEIRDLLAQHMTGLQRSLDANPLYHIPLFRNALVKGRAETLEFKLADALDPRDGVRVACLVRAFRREADVYIAARFSGGWNDHVNQRAVQASCVSSLWNSAANYFPEGARA